MVKHKGKKRPLKSDSKDDVPLTKRMFSKQLFVVLERLPDSVIASLTQPAGVRSREVASGEKCVDEVEGNTVENEEICASSTNHTTEVSTDHGNSIVNTGENEDICVSSDELEENDQQNNEVLDSDIDEEMYDNSVLITEELDIKDELFDDDIHGANSCYDSIENVDCPLGFLPIHTFDSEQPTKIRTVNSSTVHSEQPRVHSEQPEESKISLIVTYKELEFLEQQLGPLKKIQIKPNISHQSVINAISVNRKGQLEPIETVQIYQATKTFSSKQTVFEPPEKVQIVHASSSQTSNQTVLEVQNDNSNQFTYPQPSSSKQTELEQIATTNKVSVYEKMVLLEQNCAVCQAFKKNCIPSKLLIPCYRCNKYINIVSYFNHIFEIHNLQDHREVANFSRFMTQETIYCYECYLCGDLNIGLTKLKNHLRVHHRHCNICELIIHPDSNAKHSSLHYDFKSILTCSDPACRVEFSSEAEILNHYMHPTHTLKDPVVLKVPRIDGFECPYCFYSTSCMKVLTFHLRFHIRRKCPICFKNYIPTLRHVAKFTDNQKCGICSGWGLKTPTVSKPKESKKICEIEFDEIRSEMKALERYKSIESSNCPTKNVDREMDLSVEQNSQSSSLQEVAGASDKLPSVEMCTVYPEENVTEVPAMGLQVLGQQSASTLSHLATTGNRQATANKVMATPAQVLGQQSASTLSHWATTGNCQATANKVMATPAHHSASTSLPTRNPIATSSPNAAINLCEKLPELQKNPNRAIQRKLNISIAKGSKVNANSSIQIVDLCNKSGSQKLTVQEINTPTAQSKAAKQTPKLGEKLSKIEANISSELSSQGNSSGNVLIFDDELLELLKVNCTAQKASTSFKIITNASKETVRDKPRGVRLQNTATNIQVDCSPESNSKLQISSSKEASKTKVIPGAYRFVPRIASSSILKNSKELSNSKKAPELSEKTSELQKIKNCNVQRILKPSSASKSKKMTNSSTELTKISEVQKLAQDSPHNKGRSSTTNVEIITLTDPLELSEKMPEVQKVTKGSRKAQSSTSISNSNVEIITLTDPLELSDKIPELQKGANGSVALNVEATSSNDTARTKEVLENSTTNVPETCDDSSNSSIEIIDTSTETAKSNTATTSRMSCSFCTLRHFEFGPCYTSILFQQEKSIRNEFQKKPHLTQFLYKHHHFRKFIQQREMLKTLNEKSYPGYRAMFYELFEDDHSLNKIVQCYKCCSKKMPLLALYDHLIDEHLMDETCLSEIKEYVHKLKQPAANTYRCLLCEVTNLCGLKNLTEHVGSHLCRICRCKTNDSSSSILHISKHENEFKNIYYCHICKIEFNMEDSFKSHIKHFHPIFMLQSQHAKLTTSHTCPYCHFHSDSIIVIEFHLSQHNIATCSCCTSIHIPNAKHVYNSNHKMCMKCESMKGLDKIEHPPPTFKNRIPCFFCSNLYRDDLELFSHMVNTHMVCLICKFLCKSVESFNHHMVTKHGTLHYRCEKCLKLITSKLDLHAHCKEVHPDIKDMDFTEIMYYTPSFEINKQCPYCLMLFRRQAQLNQHIKIFHVVLQCGVCTMFYFLRTGCLNCNRNSRDVVEVVDL